MCWGGDVARSKLFLNYSPLAGINGADTGPEESRSSQETRAGGWCVHDQYRYLILVLPARSGCSWYGTKYMYNIVR